MHTALQILFAIQHLDYKKFIRKCIRLQNVGYSSSSLNVLIFKWNEYAYSMFIICGL